MTDKMSVVIQGGLGYGAVDIANYYAELDYVDEVIISTWVHETVDGVTSDKVKVVKSELPDKRSQNLNLQLVSSLNGVKEASNDLVMKIRSDQKIFHESFDLLMSFYNEHKDQETLNYIDGTKQHTKVFLIGNNKNYPFHPQDHLFWGHKEDLIKIFSCPEFEDETQFPQNAINPKFGDTIQTARIDFSVHLRAPIHIGAHYYSLFYPEVKEMADNPETYLMDSAPRRKEAMDFYTPIRDSIFQVFPRINMRWEKYNSGYWYGYEKDGEYYAD